MGYVYLLCDGEKFKIGMTKHKDIYKRIKELQTGNPNELNVIDYFETTKPYKLEKMMHNHFRNVNELNEWFRLEKDTVNNFKNTCQYYQTIIDSLANNPFFK